MFGTGFGNVLVISLDITKNIVYWATTGTRYPKLIWLQLGVLLFASTRVCFGLLACPGKLHRSQLTGMLRHPIRPWRWLCCGTVFSRVVNINYQLSTQLNSTPFHWVIFSLQFIQMGKKNSKNESAQCLFSKCKLLHEPNPTTKSDNLDALVNFRS